MSVAKDINTGLKINSVKLSTWDIYNYGKYINQFSPNTIKSIRQYERINKKIYRQKMSIMFNEISINEEILPKYTYTHTHTYIYIYIYISSSSCRAASTDIPDSLSRHFSLSFIASGWSSGLHPVSSQSCCMYVRTVCPAFARPYVGVHRST